MGRTLVWVEEQHFVGFGCSECGWRFEPSGVPTGTSFDQMMRTFELQRDKEFTSMFAPITQVIPAPNSADLSDHQF